MLFQTYPKNQEIEEVIGDGDFNLRNSGQTNRIWSIEVDLKNWEDLELKEDQYLKLDEKVSINELDPSSIKDIDYTFKATKPPVTVSQE